MMTWIKFFLFYILIALGSTCSEYISNTSFVLPDQVECFLEDEVQFQRHVFTEFKVNGTLNIQNISVRIKLSSFYIGENGSLLIGNVFFENSIIFEYISISSSCDLSSESGRLEINAYPFSRINLRSKQEQGNFISNEPEIFESFVAGEEIIIVDMSNQLQGFQQSIVNVVSNNQVLELSDEIQSIPLKAHQFLEFPSNSFVFRGTKIVRGVHFINMCMSVQSVKIIGAQFINSQRISFKDGYVRQSKFIESKHFKTFQATQSTLNLEVDLTDNIFDNMNKGKISGSPNKQQTNNFFSNLQNSEISSNLFSSLGNIFFSSDILFQDAYDQSESINMNLFKNVSIFYSRIRFIVGETVEKITKQLPGRLVFQDTLIYKAFPFTSRKGYHSVDIQNSTFVSTVITSPDEITLIQEYINIINSRILGNAQRKQFLKFFSSSADSFKITIISSNFVGFDNVIISSRLPQKNGNEQELIVKKSEDIKYFVSLKDIVFNNQLGVVKNIHSMFDLKQAYYFVRGGDTDFELVEYSRLNSHLELNTKLISSLQKIMEIHEHYVYFKISIPILTESNKVYLKVFSNRVNEYEFIEQGKDILLIGDNQLNILAERFYFEDGEYVSFGEIGQFELTFVKTITNLEFPPENLLRKKIRIFSQSLAVKDVTIFHMSPSVGSILLQKSDLEQIEFTQLTSNFSPIFSTVREGNGFTLNFTDFFNIDIELYINITYCQETQKIDLSFGYYCMDSCKNDQINKDNIFCENQCLNGYEQSVLVCKSCPTNCQKCEYNNKICTRCEFGFKKENGSCVKKCSNGTYEKDGECISCNIKCESCDLFQICQCFLISNPQDRRCNNCPYGWYISSSGCYECASYGCKDCDGPILYQCNECKDGFEVINGECLKSY